jgi:hypothetical protein
MMEKRNAARMLMGKPESRKPHRKPRHRWQKILKYIIEETRVMRWTPVIRSSC